MTSKRDLLVCACVIAISCHVTSSFSISMSEDYYNKDPELITTDNLMHDLRRNSLESSVQRLQPLMELYEKQLTANHDADMLSSYQPVTDTDTWQDDDVTDQNEDEEEKRGVPEHSINDVSKRYFRRSRYCNLNNINAQAFFEFLRTGKICGQRLSHMRFGLTGR